MWTPGPGFVMPPMVSIFTKQVGWVAEDLAGTNPSSANYEADATAVYYPIIMPVPCIVRRVWWANGASVDAGSTVEVGIYSTNDYGPSAKLVSGSAAQSGTTQVQFADVTDTSLTAGVYWIAVMMDWAVTQTTLMRTVCNGAHAPVLRFKEASASPLPATATPTASSSTDTALYLCGFSTVASP